MSITFPTSKPGTRAPFVVALLAALAVAGAAVVAASGLGANQSSPRAIPIGVAEPEGYQQGATLTFILVASEAQVDHLRSLQADSAAYVDPSMALHEVVIISVASADDEAQAMETIRAATDATQMVAYPPAVSVVDARETDFAPR